MNKFIKKYQLYIIPILIIATIVSLIVVNNTCKSYADIQSRIDDRPKDIIEYEHKESQELNELVNQMYEQIEKENKEKQLRIDCESNVKEEDIKALGNTLYGEARGLTDTEMSAVAWCILNRLDNGKYGASLIEVVSAKNQFSGYVKNRTYKSDKAKELLNHCEEIARDVLVRHELELNGVENVGRTLPKEYLYFLGYKGHNHFTTTWKGNVEWNWSLESPYDI